MFEKKIEKKGTIEKRKYDWRNVAKVHTQRTPIEYRATIHCTTGPALASLSFGRYSCLLGFLCPLISRSSLATSWRRRFSLFHWGVSLPLPPWPGQLPGQRERSYENCRKIKHLHTKYWCHYWTVAELFANFSGLFSADQTQFFQQTELLRTNSENSEQLSCSMCTQRVRIRAVMYQLAHSLLRHQSWWSSALLDSEV